MSDDALADRRRASEDEYFRKRDSHLVEEMRRRADRDAARQRMSLAGVLGFGKVSNREREMLDQIRGVLQPAPAPLVRAWRD